MSHFFHTISLLGFRSRLSGILMATIRIIFSLERCWRENSTIHGHHPPAPTLYYSSLRRFFLINQNWARELKMIHYKCDMEIFLMIYLHGHKYFFGSDASNSHFVSKHTQILCSILECFSYLSVTASFRYSVTRFVTRIQKFFFIIYDNQY